MSKGFIPAARPIVGDDERAAVDAVLVSGMLAQGQEVADFETEFSAELLDKLRSLHMQESYGSDLLAQGALVELMIGLNRAADSHGDLRPAGTSDQVVDAVLHYINEHYSESLTLDQLAEQFFISKYHLLRKFDAQVGTTVHSYILQKRLMNAKQLLAGGVPPNEVCQYCGFGDYANFYRAFKAEYNQTPRQYIQEAKGK